MKEHGLIFQEWKVRFLLARSVAEPQTRRPMTRVNTLVDGRQVSKEHWGQIPLAQAYYRGGEYLGQDLRVINTGSLMVRCRCRRYVEHHLTPRVQPGDVIRVKETWAPVNSESGPALLYRADGDLRFWEDWCVEPGPDEGYGPSMNYEKYPGPYSMWWSDLWNGEPGHSWRSPMMMPKWASRLRLPVLAVRPKRPRDISEMDAGAEGVSRHCPLCFQPLPCSCRSFLKYGTHEKSFRAGFRVAWNAIHGPGSFENYVWVYTMGRAANEKEVPIE